MIDDRSAAGCRTVVLRAARPDDESFLRSVYASTRADELALLSWTEAQTDAFLRMQFTAQETSYRRQWSGAAFQVIDVDDRPAGRLYVARCAGEIRVLDIALLPEYRGAGIGTRLLQDLQAEGEAAGRPVRLHVLVANDRARGLYRRLGFHMVGGDGVRLALEWSPTVGAA